MAEQNRIAAGHIQKLTAWAREARDSNAALQQSLEAQGRSAVEQIEKITGWLHEARDANAALQKAMEEQGRAHAKEMEELRGVMAHPMVKLALGVSGAGKRLARSNGGGQ